MGGYGGYGDYYGGYGRGVSSAKSSVVEDFALVSVFLTSILLF